MVYEPLHYKYRPATFADLVGQEAIASTLTNAIRRSRIAPAYLLAGPRGTGKTSSARIVAKSLNCLSFDRPTETPCGTCEVCRSIARGSALDVVEIDAASNTGVDNIRELIERAQFAPVQCRYKVYIIDECHMLSTAAFNSLLKTLEEPPAHVVFILATTDPQRVLPTIISRCQRFDYRRIPLDAMVNHLKTIAEKESIDIADDAVSLVAQIAQGGLRDAESLLDQLSLLPEQITVDRVWDLVGAVPERDLLLLCEAIADDNPQAVLDRCRHLLDRGREPPIVVQNLAGFYRDLLVAKTAPQRNDLVAVTPPTWEKLCEFVQQLDTDVILAGSQHLRACEPQIKNTTQPRLWLEVSLLGLLPSALNRPAAATSQAAPPNRPAVAPMSTHIPASPVAQSTQAAVTPAPTPQPTPEIEAPVPTSQPIPQPTPPADVPAVTPTPEPQAVSTSEVSNESEVYNLPQIWQKVLENIAMRATQELLRQQGQLIAFDGSSARIGVMSASLMKLTESKVPDIEAAFQRAFQRAVRVKLDIASSAPTHPARPAPHSMQPAAQRLHASSPHPVAPSPLPQATPPPQSPPKVAASPVDVPSVDAPIEKPATESVTPTEEPAAPTEPPDSTRAWDEEELAKVTNQFAQFFNGDVVSIDDDLDLEF
ncbi:MAG: DNA polymerase III subunit gamma/tau [Cyanobacteria bacterium SBC]|nr:DNA polymerase III subunit gamma/tau [Cyanobacteria bacterium SBC]